MKREVTDLLTNPALVKHFDESYWSADCQARHACKVFAMGQCNTVKSHYLNNFKLTFDEDSNSDDLISKMRSPINYKYSANQLDQIIAALGNCIPFYAHLYNLKASQRAQILCPFSRMMAPWKKINKLDFIHHSNCCTCVLANRSRICEHLTEKVTVMIVLPTGWPRYSSRP